MDDNGSLNSIMENIQNLNNVFRNRTNVFEYKLFDDQNKVPEGWLFEKNNGNSFLYKKEKPAWKIFEDLIWRIFYNFNFDELNIKYEPEIKFLNKKTKKKFDVLAKDDNFFFIVECKNKETLGKKDLKTVIEELNSYRLELKKLGETYYDNPKINVEIILATNNIEISAQNKDLAKRKRISIWDDSVITYIEKLSTLTNKLGSVSRYQLYALMFQSNQHFFDSVKVPCIRHKYGKNYVFTFMAKPEDLLRISYVHRRGSSLGDSEDVVLTYQRMIQETKLRSIRDYINNKNNLPFPNSIILSFGEKLRFDELNSSANIDITHGLLYLPRKFGSAWIIDGQHRLYAYSQSDRKDKDLLPVFAYIGLSSRDQAQLFIDINQNQKSVSANLLWDLKEDLYKKSDDREQIFEWIISAVGKKLASSSTSPLYKSIELPSLPKLGKSLPITLTTICENIKRIKILSDDYIKIDFDNPQKTVDVLYKNLSLYFSYFKSQLANDWNKKKDGFTQSSNGASALLWLFKQIIHYMNYKNKQEIYRSPNEEELNKLFCDLLVPIKEKFLQDPNIGDSLRQKRGVGGQKESANYLCKEIKIKEEDFPLLLEEDFSKLDLDARIKRTEKRLQDLVINNLLNEYGKDWYIKAIPQDIVETIENLIEREKAQWPWKTFTINVDKFRFVQIGDLMKIIVCKKNWDLFQEVFVSKSNFESKCKEFINIRNYHLAHQRPAEKIQYDLGIASMNWINNCLDASNSSEV